MISNTVNLPAISFLNYNYDSLFYALLSPMIHALSIPKSFVTWPKRSHLPKVFIYLYISEMYPSNSVWAHFKNFKTKHTLFSTMLALEHLFKWGLIQSPLNENIPINLIRFWMIKPLKLVAQYNASCVCCKFKPIILLIEPKYSTERSCGTITLEPEFRN